MHTSISFRDLRPLFNSPRAHPSRRCLVLSLIPPVCFALSPPAGAQCREGCAGGNTFLGLNALNPNSTGLANTALGSGTLTINMSGSDNTAVGFSALQDNQTGSHNTATGEDALYYNRASDNTATVLRRSR